MRGHDLGISLFKQSLHTSFSVFQINAYGYVFFSPNSNQGFRGIGAYVTAGADGLVINGTVFYRTTTDTELLCRASHKVRSFFLDLPNYDATWMMVFTWRTTYDSHRLFQNNTEEVLLQEGEAQVEKTHVIINLLN